MQATIQYENKSQCGVSLLLLQAAFMDVWDAKPEMIDSLRKMPPDELISLLERLASQGSIKIIVTEAGLKDAFDQCEKHIRTRNQLLTLVARGATVEMISKLFPINKTNAARLGFIQKGRELKPNDCISQKIKDAWAKLGHIISLPERYLLLADMFPDFSLAFLERALKVEHKFSQNELQQFFVRGANAVMICRLFPISRKKALMMAQQILGKRLPVNYPKPEFNISHKINKAWTDLRQEEEKFWVRYPDRKLSEIVSLRERYLRLASMFPEWSLASLDRVLKERDFLPVSKQGQNDAPVVIICEYQAGVDGMCLPKIEPLFEAINVAPKLIENHLNSPVVVPPPKPIKARPKPPSPTKSHPWVHTF